VLFENTLSLLFFILRNCTNELPVDIARSDEYFELFVGKNKISRVVLSLH